jgi:vancomycin resistance protein YoaR
MGKQIFNDGSEFMAKKRYYILALIALFIILLSACGEKADNAKKIVYEEPERTIKSNVYLEGRNVGGIGESKLLEILNENALKTDVKVTDAAFDEKTWAIIKEKPGTKLNIEKTAEALLNAYEGDKLSYVLDITAPLITSEQLKKNINTIASYTTPLLDRRDSRVNNIEIASNRINFMVLQPGEEFSFNRTVGKRTGAKGYEEAPIIVATPKGPKKKDAKGGGICQISTTLYNAVEECRLDVTERHLHSAEVGYVPRGEDATVSYGGVDFKFKNNRSNPIMIRIFLKSQSLTVKIIENSNKTV